MFRYRARACERRESVVNVRKLLRQWLQACKKSEQSPIPDRFATFSHQHTTRSIRA